MNDKGGLAEVTLEQEDEHKIVVRMGPHRVFDIVDGVAVHKTSGKNDTVFANPRDLMEKLGKLLRDKGVKPSST